MCPELVSDDSRSCHVDDMTYHNWHTFYVFHFPNTPTFLFFSSSSFWSRSFWSRRAFSLSCICLLPVGTQKSCPYLLPSNWLPGLLYWKIKNQLENRTLASNLPPYNGWLWVCSCQNRVLSNVESNPLDIHINDILDINFIVPLLTAMLIRFFLSPLYLLIVNRQTDYRWMLKQMSG